MTKICKDIVLPYRFVRHEEQVLIGETRGIHHRELVKIFLGPDVDEQKIKDALKANSENWDMGLICRDGVNKLSVGHISETYDFPTRNGLPEVRKTTLNALRKKYPEEN